MANVINNIAQYLNKTNTNVRNWVISGESYAKQIEGNYRNDAISLLKYNITNRNNNLESNEGLYEMYKDTAGAIIGYAYDNYGSGKASFSRIGEGGLFGYTHSGITPYSKALNVFYDRGEEDGELHKYERTEQQKPAAAREDKLYRTPDTEYDPTFAKLNNSQYDNISRDTVYDVNGATALGDYFDPASVPSDSIIRKTSILQSSGIFGSMISRQGEAATKSDFQTSVVNDRVSRGRNLLNRKDEYCRTWTKSIKFNQISDLTRPFIKDNGEPYDLEELHPQYAKINGNGAQRLRDNSVLMKTGFVRMSPTNDANQEWNTAKKCMLSLENLAWKDVSIATQKDLSYEERGPNGGRIMWFMPYNIAFNESVDVNWNTVSFIGRGENLFTYTNTTRSGTLSFDIVVDHPSSLDYWNISGSPVPDDDRGIDNNEGEGPKSTVINRFFAGCEPFPGGNPSGITGENPVNPNPDTGRTKDEVKKIRCRVFFPNNYSGIDDIGDKKWSEYMLHGYQRNTGRTDTIRGYEMLTNNKQGLNDSPIDAIPSDNPYGKFAYRVDKGSTYINQVFSHSSYYRDTASFALNSKADTSSPDKYISFAGLYELMTETTLGGGIVIDDYTKNTITELKKYIDKGQINKVSIEGFASNAGTVTSAEALANNMPLSLHRAGVLKQWLINTSYFNSHKDKFPTTSDMHAIGRSTAASLSKPKADPNSELAKKDRYADIVFYIGTSTIDSVNDSDTLLNSTVVANSGKMTIKSSNDKVLRKTDNFILPKVENSVLNPGAVVKTFENRLDTAAKQNFDSQVSALTEQLNAITQGSTLPRYGNEYRFYQNKKVNDLIVPQSIYQKFQFLDRCFHTTTPEGLNLRLTFLHQCTRQGNTTGVGQSKGSAPEIAGNLAFGRPPICVLRLGDFYNTKIIIRSMQIQYEKGLWDINQEGIGVQPMIATIQIGITFIGGSDIAGPIAELQNAMSFNYYGNTSVYDNRAAYKKTYTGKSSETEKYQITEEVNNSYRPDLIQ